MEIEVGVNTPKMELTEKIMFEFFERQSIGTDMRNMNQLKIVLEKEKFRRITSFNMMLYMRIKRLKMLQNQIFSRNIVCTTAMHTIRIFGGLINSYMPNQNEV